MDTKTGKGMLDDDNEIFHKEDDEISCGEGDEVKNDILLPEVGLTFQDLEEMYEFYRSYAQKTGFPVVRKFKKNGDDGKAKYITLACARSYKLESSISNDVGAKSRPKCGTECKAKISARLNLDDKWEISKIILDHNHELVTPTKTRYFRCNRKISEYVKRRLISNDKAGVRPNKSFNTLVVEAGGHEKVGCINKDVRNFLDRERRMRLGEGDALALQKYFLRMQAQNTGFVFSMDLDEENRLKNVFWADGRSREAYKEFGDVVTFDSTYLKWTREIVEHTGPSWQFLLPGKPTTLAT